MIYVVVFILLLIPVVKYDLMAKSGGENKWYYLNLIVLILLAGLRYRVGGDTLMYMSVYNEWPAIDELKYFDFETALYNPLWYIYTSLPRSISDEFWVFQMIQAVIVNSVFFWFFKKYSPQYYFSAILLYYVGYYCYFNMEIMREILCICVLMLVTPCLLNKRWIPYYIGCVVAVYIHFSAIIMFFLPLLFLLFRKPSWKVLLLIMGSVIVFLNIVNLAALLVSIFSLNDKLAVLIEKYMDNQSNIAGMISEFITFLPVLGIVYLREQNQDIDYKDKFLPIVMGIVFAFSLAMGFVGFARFVNYFIPFVLVVTVHTVYYYLSNVELKLRQVSSTVLVGTLCVLFFNYSYYYVRDMSEYYPNTRFGEIFTPYHTIFDKQVEEKREKFIENYRDVGIFF